MAAPLQAAPGVDDRPARLRLIVETDAGGDPDDEQSLVRFLLYANEWDVEGIIATRALARDGENRNAERTGLGIVRRLVRAYGECQPNLRTHDDRYPKAEALLERTVAGYGGDGGVDLIMKAVDAPDPRPVWFLNWGTDHGSDESSLKRALDRVLKEPPAEGYARFKNRLRLSSADRFGDHTTTIGPPFPLWIDTFRPEVDRRRWYHRFSALTATAGGFDVQRDVLTGHGPLGALYPTNTTHPQKEGDSMTFLYLAPTGMNDPDHPGWGSWAGRYGRQEAFPDREYYWANQRDTWNGSTHRDNTLARFAADLQNDFRARLNWCVKPFSEANHPPVVRIAGDRQRAATDGERVVLDASETSDPDGDELTFRWWIYREVEPQRGDGRIEDAQSPKASFVPAPGESAGTVHVILTVTDRGSPPLARYGRVIINVGQRSD
ncbi:MAG TPA: nucleoside hydrolase-like domain-containing protein [Planctomycetaceae bacterium]|nr:nucleoside hydrolase-like domain-containing protein [Planctomycetaceae bacterium]